MDLQRLQRELHRRGLLQSECVHLGRALEAVAFAMELFFYIYPIVGGRKVYPSDIHSQAPEGCRALVDAQEHAAAILTHPSLSGLCHRCEAPNSKTDICPFNWEIHEEKTVCVCCDACRDQCFMDT